MEPVLTDTLQLFPDGLYHGRTENGKEIIVTPAMMESYKPALRQQQVYEGQADFWLHDPDMWVGGVRLGHARYAQ